MAHTGDPHGSCTGRTKAIGICANICSCARCKCVLLVANVVLSEGAAGKKTARPRRRGNVMRKMHSHVSKQRIFKLLLFSLASHQQRFHRRLYRSTGCDEDSTEEKSLHQFRGAPINQSIDHSNVRPTGNLRGFRWSID